MPINLISPPKYLSNKHPLKPMEGIHIDLNGVVLHQNKYKTFKIVFVVLNLEK